MYYNLCQSRSPAWFRYNYAMLNCIRSMVLPFGTSRLLRVSLLNRRCMMVRALLMDCNIHVYKRSGSLENTYPWIHMKGSIFSCFPFMCRSHLHLIKLTYRGIKCSVYIANSLLPQMELGQIAPSNEYMQNVKETSRNLTLWDGLVFAI